MYQIRGIFSVNTKHIQLFCRVFGLGAEDEDGMQMEIPENI